MEVRPEEWPWVFEKSSKPSLVISSLESLAVLMALMEHEHRSSIRIVPTIIDNRGNGSALNKLMSTKYPERHHLGDGELHKKKGIRASVEWAPREGNREADALAQILRPSQLRELPRRNQKGRKRRREDRLRFRDPW